MRDLRLGIKQMVSRNLPEGHRIGKVVAVDGESTCDVLIESEGITLYDVRLSVDGSTDGIVLVPQVQSDVIVAPMFNNPHMNYLAMVGKADKVIIRGGGHAGLVISQETAKKLNAIEDDLNNLKSIFLNWTPVSQDGGAALKGAATTWYQSRLTKTKSTDLENSKVTHG